MRLEAEAEDPGAKARKAEEAARERRLAQTEQRRRLDRLREYQRGRGHGLYNRHELDPKDWDEEDWDEERGEQRMQATRERWASAHFSASEIVSHHHSNRGRVLCGLCALL